MLIPFGIVGFDKTRKKFLELLKDKSKSRSL